MPWRKAHGTARRIGRQTVLESCPADELPPASPVASVPRERGVDGKFLPGNNSARMAKWRSGPNGVLARLEAQGDPDWQASNRWGRRYAAHRVSELTRMHGGELSAGVCSIVTLAAQHMSDARWLRAKGAADGKLELIRMAANIATNARQAERDAWELASREARARREVAQDSGPDLSAQIADGVASPPTPALPAGDSTPVPPLAPPGGHCVEGPHPPKEPPK